MMSKLAQMITQNKKDFLILGLILVGVIIFHIYSVTSAYKNEEFSDIDFIYLILPLLCSAFSFAVARKFSFSDIFGKAYISLGISFAFLFCAEFTYVVIYEIILQQDPYPSIADVFYLVFYPFAIYHMKKNISYFLDVTKIHYTIIVGITLLITLIYFGLSFDGTINLIFLFGIIPVAGSAFVFSLSIVGFMAFQKGVMGKVWIILVLGISLHTVANIWYYYLEVFEYYTGTHVVNTLWVAAWTLIVYALYIHKKEV